MMTMVFMVNSGPVLLFGCFLQKLQQFLHGVIFLGLVHVTQSRSVLFILRLLLLLRLEADIRVRLTLTDTRDKRDRVIILLKIFEVR